MGICIVDKRVGRTGMRPMVGTLGGVAGDAGCRVGAIPTPLVAGAVMVLCATWLGRGSWAVLLRVGQRSFDYRLQVWDVLRRDGDQVREDVVVGWWKPVRQEGVCTREIRWQGC